MVPTVAESDELYEPQVVPKCTVYKVGAIEICGYTMEEWKLVLKADAELVSTRTLLAKEKQRSGNLELQVKDLREVARVYAESQAVLVGRVDKLTGDFIALDKKYQDERVKPRIGSPVAWSITAAVAALAGGYILKDRL